MVMNLPAASARDACHGARDGIRACAIADFAKFLARDSDLGVYSRSGFLEAQLHVIAQVRAALRACSATARAGAPPKDIFKSKEHAKNIPKFATDVLIYAAAESPA